MFKKNSGKSGVARIAEKKKNGEFRL